MSMTKRMMEGGYRPARNTKGQARAAAEREDHVASVFRITRTYHHAFVNSKLRKKQMDVYRLLYPHGRPSTTKFYGDLKQAGEL